MIKNMNEVKYIFNLALVPLTWTIGSASSSARETPDLTSSSVALGTLDSPRCLFLALAMASALLYIQFGKGILVHFVHLVCIMWCKSV